MTTTTKTSERKAAARKAVPLVVILSIIIVGVAVQALCAQLDLPPGKLLRNLVAPSKPSSVTPKYSCGIGEIAALVTVVVTVKDACSQMPEFVAALKEVVGPETALILTYPRFESCAPETLGVDVASWKKVRTIALPPDSSPMRGWVDAAELVDTKYALLLHNDGYAIDDFFACELLRALETRNGSYAVAAPMLYESKADGSLAAHATQSRLRVVDGVVRHDHSLARALNRGADYDEGEQTDFLEDHGFMIETDKITTVVDPSASYTLEYIDMILSLKSRGWKVLFVPTARLEFRIAEFSWRDIPYFMYKRSEATCHGTRDYLAKKWDSKFPNTGFWTYIKYTIVESHEFPESELEELPWHQHASLFLGFFQMAGYNRYFINDSTFQYVALLDALDSGTLSTLGPISASRVTARTQPATVRNASKASHLLPTLDKGWLPSIEADMPLEYLPFAVAELRWPGRRCRRVLSDSGANLTFPKHLCGVAAQHGDSCSCWVNLPTFKAHSALMTFLASLASLAKLPSRVTTYLEMFLGSTNKAANHVYALDPWRDRLTTFRVATCGGAKTATAALDEPCDDLDFRFDDASRVVHFSGRPATPDELDAALRRIYSL